jgi:hypothetical protein
MTGILGFLRWLLEILSLPLRAVLASPGLVFGSGRFPRLSLPVRVALLMFFVLVIVVTVTVALYPVMFKPSGQSFWVEFPPGFWVTVLVLVFLIPFVLYKALALWLEGPSSPYPEIDKAWKAGLREMQRKGLDLRQVPLFLVLGSTNEQQEQAIFHAAGREFLVSGEPQGNYWLHWYAQEDAVYVLASEVSCLSGLRRSVSASHGADPLAEEPAAPGRPQPGQDIRQTIAVGGSPRSARPDPSEAAAPRRQQDLAPAPVSGDIRGTMTGPPSAQKTVIRAGEPATPIVPASKSFIDEQRKRLAWLCRLIRRHRLPFAPINGVLALLPFSYAQSSQPGVRTVLTESLRNDLEQILATLLLRFPVTVMITEMDDEPGFREFIRRMVQRQGPQWVKDHRFGKRFPLDIPATPDRVARLAMHLSAAFEGWIYDFFHDEEAILRSAGNAGLYTFLGKVRQAAKNLATVFNCFSSLHPRSSGGASPAEVVFFAGCYFAGAGKTDERQVFVKSVLERPIEQQEELEWTAEALREDDRFQWLGLIAAAVDTLLVVAFVIVGVIWFRYKH